MKVLQYCQYVLGIGHFFRSFEIAKELYPHRVMFVEGGKTFEDIEIPSHIERFILPPLMMDEEFSRFDVDDQVLEAIKAQRHQLLLQAYSSFKPQVVLVELFPFGRKKFSFELIPLLEEIARAREKVLVACSLRDILVEKANQDLYEEGVLRHLNKYFDLLLIHADERIVKLEETFSRVSYINVPIVYTGFVVRRPKERVNSKTSQEVRIVVSTGGGKVGSELIEAVIEAMSFVKFDFVKMDLYLGIFMKEENKKRLLELAGKDPRITVRPFAKDFIEKLSEADFSISMAGYNTIMDLVGAGIPGLVYPFDKNREQLFRAEKFARFGMVTILEALDPILISAKINDFIEKRRWWNTSTTASSHPYLPMININGAQNTKEALESLCKRLGIMTNSC